MRATTLALCALLAACGGGDSDGASDSLPSGSLSAPGSPQTTKTGDKATVAWDTVSGAKSYHIYFSSSPDLELDQYASYENAGWVQNVTPPHTITLPDPAQNYFFLITAVRGDDESRPAATSVVGIFRVAPTDPSVVQDLDQGLEWKRCAEGRTWNNGTCEGDATLYQDNDIKGQFSNASPEGWRVPQSREFVQMTLCKDNLAHPFEFAEKCDAALADLFPDHGTGYPPFYVINTALSGICGSAFGSGGYGCAIPSDSDRVLRVLLTRPID